MTADPFVTTNDTNGADPFADPTDSTFFGKMEKRSVEGALLAFEVKGFNPDKPTKESKPGKATPMVLASVFVLDGEHKGKSWENSELYGNYVGSLRDHVGRIVVGRWEKGTPKKGYEDNPPWVITKATDAEKLVAREWYTARNA